MSNGILVKDLYSGEREPANDITIPQDAPQEQAPAPKPLEGKLPTIGQRLLALTPSN
jgi:hypothetical protein